LGNLRDSILDIHINGVQGGENRIELILNMLSEEDKADLESLLENRLITAGTIAKALTDMDPLYAVSERTVQRYRRTLREAK